MHGPFVPCQEASLSEGASPLDAARVLSEEEGAKLVVFARQTLELYLRSGRTPGPLVGGAFGERRGVFCTLHTYPEGDLRGCVGLPYPDKSVSEAITSAALGAATDPRFPPLRLKELPKVTVEVSVLTPPQEVQAASHGDYPSAVRPGVDGLILRYGHRAGLLLPQVWESLPDPVEFLATLCYKAGIARADAWRDAGARLYRFRAQVFAEQAPNGAVTEVR